MSELDDRARELDDRVQAFRRFTIWLGIALGTVLLLVWTC